MEIAVISTSFSRLLLNGFELPGFSQLGKISGSRRRGYLWGCCTYRCRIFMGYSAWADILTHSSPYPVLFLLTRKKRNIISSRSRNTKAHSKMCVERGLRASSPAYCARVCVRSSKHSQNTLSYLRKDYTYFYSSLANLNTSPCIIARCQSTLRNHFKGLRHRTDTQTFGTTAIIFKLELHGYIYIKKSLILLFLRVGTNAFLQSANKDFPHLITSIRTPPSTWPSPPTASCHFRC